MYQLHLQFELPFIILVTDVHWPCLNIIYTGQILTEDDCDKIYTAVFDARGKWRQIGRQLGLKRPDLTDIETRYKAEGNERCLEEMLALWLKRPRLNPTWETLVDALAAKIVDEEALSLSVKEKYMKPAAPEESSDQGAVAGGDDRVTASKGN